MRNQGHGRFRPLTTKAKSKHVRKADAGCRLTGSSVVGPHPTPSVAPVFLPISAWWCQRKAIPVVILAPGASTCQASNCKWLSQPSSSSLMRRSSRARAKWKLQEHKAQAHPNSTWSQRSAPNWSSEAFVMDVGSVVEPDSKWCTDEDHSPQSACAQPQGQNEQPSVWRPAGQQQGTTHPQATSVQSQEPPKETTTWLNPFPSICCHGAPLVGLGPTLLEPPENLIVAKPT